MKAYLDLMRHVLEHGAKKTDRTGTGTLSVFGHQMRFDLSERFPLVTTKKRAHEERDPRAAVVPAGRDQRALPEGERRHDLGRMGRRARRAGSRLRPPVALVAGARTGGTSTRSAEVVSQIRANPDSRRLIVSAWNVADIPRMALAPCHALFQFYVGERAPVLPALPAQRRHLPRRALQHRLLRAAHDDGRAGDGPQARGVRPHPRRRPPLPEPPRPGARAALARAARRCP